MSTVREVLIEWLYESNLIEHLDKPFLGIFFSGMTRGILILPISFITNYMYDGIIVLKQSAYRARNVAKVLSYAPRAGLTHFLEAFRSLFLFNYYGLHSRVSFSSAYLCLPM